MPRQPVPALDLPVVGGGRFVLGTRPPERGATSIGIEEPALFSEPGVFLARPDGTFYYGSTQTMPFARPSFSDLLAAVDFAIAKDYPARCAYTGEA